MNVFLVNPISEVARSSGTYIHSVTPLPSLGMAYLAGMLKRDGIGVMVEDQYASALGNRALLEKIRGFNPDVVGISCLTTAMSVVREIAAAIRSGTKAKIIAGNIHATIFPEQMLREGAADIVVRGEGEITFSETLKALREGTPLSRVAGISFLEDGKPAHTPDRPPAGDLDSLPFPAWEYFDLTRYRRYPMLGIYDKSVLPVQASRGCPFKCVFCSQEKFYKKPRYRRMARVADEIAYLHETFGIECVGFNDAYFPFTKETGLEFCDELIRRKLHKKVRWFTETRVDMVDEELMRRMKESGLLLVMYGFESGNEKVLEASGKGTTLDQARKAMRITKAHKVRSMGLFMLGLPDDTRESCRDTIRFAQEIDPDIVKFNIATPFPGSAFFDGLKNRDTGGFDRTLTSWPDWASLGGDIYSPKNMSSREVLDLQRQGMLGFYLRPRTVLKHLFGGVFSLPDMLFGGYILVKNYLRSLTR